MPKTRVNYEPDERFDHNRFRVRGYQGIAWVVYGWETEPNEDTVWTGQEVRTGNVAALMVGDDRKHSIDPDDLIPLGDDDYCHECGQVGCCADGRDRS